MASSLSNIIHNLAEGIHKIKCKYGHNNKNMRRVELNINNADLNVPTLKMI